MLLMSTPERKQSIACPQSDAVCKELQDSGRNPRVIDAWLWPEGRLLFSEPLACVCPHGSGSGFPSL